MTAERTTKHQLASLQSAAWAVLEYLDTLTTKGVDPELLKPIKFALTCSDNTLTKRDIKRGQEIHRMMTGPHGKPRKITMSEQVSAYLQGYRDAGA